MINSLKILFICTGNTCRSPMAEALANKFVSEFFEDVNGLFDFKSAGINASSGDHVSELANQALKEYEIELEDFKTLKLNLKLVEDSDLILTSTSFQRDTLINKYPKAIQKTFTLKEFILKFLKEDALAMKIAENFSKRLSEMVVYKSSFEKWKEISQALRSIPQEEIVIKDLEIIDPAGGEIEDYKRVRDELDSFIRYLILFFIGGKTWKYGFKK